MDEIESMDQDSIQIRVSVGNPSRGQSEFIKMKDITCGSVF
jgi:hypothetical protein